MRVLIAEDDRTSRDILTAILKSWDYDPIVTEDGDAAWDILKEPDAPRLVLLDGNLPGMDGLDVCRLLRAVASPQPPYVIMLTARGGKEDIVRGLEAGANDYIAKPYYNQELQARIGVGRRMLELQSSLLDAKDTLTARVLELQRALEENKTLRGIIPICANCKKIRNDAGFWTQVEVYVRDHSSAEFSHGICPECIIKLYPGVEM